MFRASIAIHELTLQIILHLAGVFYFFERIFYSLFKPIEFWRRADALIVGEPVGRIIYPVLRMHICDMA